jgi:hypothetical protein
MFAALLDVVCMGPAWNGKDGSVGSALFGVCLKFAAAAAGVRTMGDPSVVGLPPCATGGADACSVGVELMVDLCPGGVVRDATVDHEAAT